MKRNLILQLLPFLLLGIVIMGCKKDNPTKNSDNTSSSKLEIGEYYQGGIIFHLDASGKHGLIISIDELSEGISWATINDTLTDANSMSDGFSNTTKINQVAGGDSSAVQLCLDYSHDGYDDWYLPAVNEYYYLRQKKGNNGAYMNDNTVRIAVNKGISKQGGDLFEYGKRYWTSTEDNNGGIIGKNKAYAFRIAAPDSNKYFNPPYISWNKTSKWHVRAIRKF